MFTQKGNYRISGFKTQPLSADDVRFNRATWGRRALSIAVAAAASLPAALVAAPAQAATSDGWNQIEPAAVVAPFSEEEIRALLESGDNLGANSRTMANLFAAGYVYRS